MHKASLAPILSAILAETCEHTCCQLMTVCALRSLPATKIRWNTTAWMCHTLISTWKRHHFWSPILLLPEWSCFRAWNIGFVASFDEIAWFLEVIFVWHGTMCRWTFRSSDRSSGADLSGTAWQNIWKHRETLHFYMLLGAWIFSWWKKTILSTTSLMFCRGMFLKCLQLDLQVRLRSIPWFYQWLYMNSSAKWP